MRFALFATLAAVNLGYFAFRSGYPISLVAGGMCLALALVYVRERKS